MCKQRMCSQVQATRLSASFYLKFSTENSLNVWVQVRKFFVVGEFQSLKPYRTALYQMLKPEHSTHHSLDRTDEKGLLCGHPELEALPHRP
jgi:hypothetical protein